MAQNERTTYASRVAYEQGRQTRFAHSPYYLEMELTQRMAALDEEGALRTLGEINRLQRAALSQDPLRSLKNSLIGSCTIFARAAILGGAHVDDAFALSDVCIRVIEGFGEALPLSGFESEMVRLFIAVARDKNDQGFSQLVRQAVDYVRVHLLEPITAGDVARGVYVHPAYLSACFKRETGDTLTHYIQKERVREAQRMLRRGRESAASVASACQFCSQSYFIQVFKKYTGLTPEQFRHMEGLR